MQSFPSDARMLKRVEIPNYGPFVFGRKRSVVPPETPVFKTPSVRIVRAALDINAIRAAAKSLKPIYRAEEDILANGNFGDCTCAGAHHIQAILTAISHPNDWRLPTAMDALWTYSRVTQPPFNIATGANDGGADLITVLDFWKANGVFSDGTGKIKSYAAVDPTNQDAIRAAIATNRNLYMGAELPSAWLKAPPVWDVAGPSVPEDGHCVITYDANDQGVQIDSWGQFFTITWAALAKYFSASAGGEVYTVTAA